MLQFARPMTAFVAALCLAPLAPVAFSADAPVNVMFIVDASGSMKKAIGKESRMTAAKRALKDTLDSIPDNARLGLTLYGHRRAGDCKDIELVSPIGADDAPALAKKIAALQPKGETPIADALRHATRSFTAFQGQSNRIVLVTDGIEECRGDPCAAARAVKDAGLDLKVDVVGFTLNAAQRQTVECVADITGGTYYDAQNASSLTTALAEVREVVTVAAPATPAGVDLLAEKNGGALLAAPSKAWSATVDGKETYVWGLDAETEGVYGFKDDRAATFDAFGVFIDRADKFNPQTLELLAGDDSPTGAFRSIATCTFQNIKLLRSLYQECKFDPVTARFLKVRVVASFKEKDARIYASEFKLVGQLAEAGAKAAAAPAKPAASGAVDLLAQKNGGALLAAPSKAWSATVDGKETYVWGLDADAEGVYGFKGDRAATFDTFGVFIDRADKFNPQTLELLAGDDGPTGKFRSVATCTFQNVKLLRSLYQACTFDPVTARYVKVRVVASFKEKDARIYASEFKLTGTLGEATKSPPAPAKPAIGGAIDLLAAKNGGGLLAAPADAWSATVDGKEGYVWGLNPDAEGVYGFKDDKAATFDTFAVFIDRTDKFNPQTLEVLAGDESPTGKFRSVATCTFENVKLLRTLYQECKFDPVTARFVKVRVVSSFKPNDARIYASEFKLMGKLGK